MDKGWNRKRKVSETEIDSETKPKKPPVKYVGETSRSAYERLKEHFKDFDNLSIKSHMLKHYIEKHRNIRKEEMKFSIIQEDRFV